MARLTGLLSRLISGRNGRRRQEPIALLSPPSEDPPDVRKRPPEEILGIEVAWALRSKALMVKAYDPNQHRRKPEQKQAGQIGPPKRQIRPDGSGKADQESPEIRQGKGKEWRPTPHTGVRAVQGQKMWRSIAYHQEPVSLWLMLQEWGDKSLDNEFIAINRSVKKPLDRYFARRNRASHGQSRPYRLFLDAYDDHVLPYDDPHFDGHNLRGRDLITVGLTHGMVGSGRGPNASLYGTVVPYSREVASWRQFSIGNQSPTQPIGKWISIPVS